MLGGSYGAAPAAKPRRASRAWGLTSADVAKAVGCVLLPPIVFFATSTLLCFRVRFLLPRGTWLLVVPLAAPAVLCGIAARRAVRAGLDGHWPKLAAVLFGAASLVAVVISEMNYWYFSQPYFLLDSLRAYDDVNPAEMDGVRLMDAGRVRFDEGARLATDMAMSYTSWDIYCVAPITTAVGLPSQGSRLMSYDLWAVGVNCCRAGETNFRCGEYDKAAAHSGLRQVSAEQRPYFRLAVQQAEAEYNIEATHPIFFYWVEDPLHEQQLFFEAAFSNWILANALHFAANAFTIVAFVALFNKASRSAGAHLARALGV
mmetsp:Transcript_126650/g.364238  ORF Transcript_126650/g.364238 Transcript_126650/m.364238 type:complete len:316 (-) Transcript_126650:65-1012(-)